MDEYRGKKVLITGGLGFIGSNLAIRLAQSGASVSIVDSVDPTCGGNYFNIDPVRKDLEVVKGDSRDLDLMRRLVRDKNYIFSLAGHVSHIDSMQDPFKDLQMNCVAPLTVLEACKHENRDARIVYSGTRQSYGRPESLPIVETQRLKPVDINGVNKMAGEWYHMVYHQCVRHADGFPAAGQHLRSAATRQALPTGLRGLVHQAGHRWRSKSRFSATASSCAASTMWTTLWKRCWWQVRIPA